MACFRSFQKVVRALLQPIAIRSQLIWMAISALCLLSLPLTSVAQIRVHSGGNAYTDSSGNIWSSDADFQGGNTYATSTPISNTSDSGLYQTERYGNFQYNFGVPNGSYTVTLKFAELYWDAAGHRVFDVSLNDQQVLTNFDIFSAAGGRYIAVDKVFTVNVTNSSINLAFVGVVDNPKVDAIQIVTQGSPPTAASTAYRVHAGGGTYTDSSGKTWSPDADYQGGNVYASSNSIANTSDPALYQTERYGNFQYAFVVPNGSYTVTLKFAELYWNAAGDRVFDVAINGQQVLTNFDIFAAANGQEKAIDQSFPINVTGGQISVVFTGVVDNPKVDAIQVLGGQQTSPPTTNPPAPTTNPTTYRIKAGGGTYTDASGNLWNADADYQGGSTYSTSNALSGTVDSALYQTERYGAFQYNFPVVNGTYTVTLKFAELYWNAPGQRMFDVSINGVQLLTNFDVFNLAGGQFRPLDESFLVVVTNQAINISFNSVIDNPKVDAIQILQTSTVAPLPATAASIFLNSLGVNTHVAQGYNAQNYVAPINYLGLRNIRDSALNLITLSTLLQATNTKVDLIVGCEQISPDATTLLPSIEQNVSSHGLLLSIEGPNEPNNFPITYENQQGGGTCSTCSWTPVAQCQQALYSAVKNDSSLSQYPVVTLSEGGAETSNVGLQFLTVPTGTGASLPAGTQYGDFVNMHNYVSSNQSSLYEDNQAWLAADTQQNGFPGDTLSGEFGVTRFNGYNGYNSSQLLTVPKFTTETGWDSVGNPGGEAVQGKVLTNVFLDQFKRGWAYTFIYELIDGEGGNTNQGLFHADYTPKLAATYIHNLTTILADTGSIATAGTLGYTITNAPVTIHDLLLQKTNGNFALVLWDERVSASDTITVNFGATVNQVSVYDVTAGTTPIQTLTNVSSATFTLTDHALILFLM